MPKVAYSEEEREKIRERLIAAGLELMTQQGIQHTTVEQIYKKVGISRTFFYSFFPTKEELIVETLYLQQPRLIDYTRKLMNDPALSWREGVEQLLYSLCYGEKYGIIVLTMEEQQLIFKRLSEKNYKIFREKQLRLFNTILNICGIYVNEEQLKVFLKLAIITVITYRVFPNTFPLLISEVSKETVDFQIHTLVDYLEKLKK